MAAMSPKSYPLDNHVAGDQDEAEMEAEAAAIGPDITRHIQLKSSHSTQVLDKAVALRRIRHRKRLNKVRAAVGALFTSPFTHESGDTRHTKWVDEPFTSL